MVCSWQEVCSLPCRLQWAWAWASSGVGAEEQRQPRLITGRGASARQSVGGGDEVTDRARNEE